MGVRPFPFLYFVFLLTRLYHILEHKLKIELVTDSDEFTPHAIKEQPNAPPSLLSRIAGSHIKPASNQIPKNAVAVHPVYVSG